MLEILDPEQNKTFRDHYLEVDFDLSNVLFIATANSLNMSNALKDRMEIIEIPGYSIEDKVKIAREHLIKRAAIDTGWNMDDIVISDDAIKYLIQNYTSEQGVRELKRLVATICRKIITNFVKSNDESIELLVDINNVKEYLGKELFDYTKKEKTNQKSYDCISGWPGCLRICILTHSNLC